MPISNKRVPNVRDVDRAVKAIYDDINDIINSVNAETNKGSENKGKPGDIRVVKDTSSKINTTKHKLEFRSEEGWDKTVTMPRNPDNHAMMAYNSETETFEWVNIDNVLEVTFGSPGVANLSTGVSSAQNQTGSSVGIEIDETIQNGTIVVGSEGGDISKLKTQTMTGDISITADGVTSITGINSNSGLSFAEIDPSGVSTPTDGNGGVLYVSNSDGKLYYKSYEVQVDLTATGGSISALNDINNVSITNPQVNDYLRWNGSSWINATLGAILTLSWTSITFAGYSSSMLIGDSASTWLVASDNDAYGPKFTGVFENGPPVETEIHVEVESGWDNDISGWTGDKYTWPASSSEGTAPNNLKFPEITNETEAIYVRFRGFARQFAGQDDGDRAISSYKTVNFYNYVRDGTCSASTDFSSNNDILDISGETLTTDIKQNWGTINAGSGDHVVLAYPKRLGTLNTTGSSCHFRINNISAGFSLVDASGISHTNNAVDSEGNAAGKTEDFYVYKCDADGTGNYNFTTLNTGSTRNLIFLALTPDNTPTNDEINSTPYYWADDSSTDPDELDQSLNATNYIVVAYPTRGQTQLSSNAFRFKANGESDAIQAGFTQSTSDHTNEFGFVESYYKDISNSSGWGNGTLTTDNNSIQNERRWGETTETGTIDSADINALEYFDVGTDATTTSWGGINSDTASKYVMIAFRDGLSYSSKPNNTKNFRLNDITANFNPGTLSHTNRFGFTENYDWWRCSVSNTGNAALTTNNGTNVRNVMNYGVSTNQSDVDGLSNKYFDESGGSDYKLPTNINDSLNAGVNEYIVVSYSARLSTMDNEAFRWKPDGESNAITARFNQNTSDYINLYGFTENYRRYSSHITNLGLGTLTTSHSTVQNEVRWGYINEATLGDIDSADINAMTGFDISTDTSRVWGTSFAPGSGNYACIAFPGRLTALSSTKFRMTGADGYSISAGFSSAPIDDHSNRFGYEEDYDVWRCDIANTPDATMETLSSGSIQNYFKWGNTATSYDAMTSDHINNLSSGDIRTEETSDFGTVDSGSNYITIAYPSRYGTISNSNAFRIDGITSEFDTDTVTNVNPYGYSETYRIYQCKKANTGNYSFSTNNTQKIVEMRFGATATERLSLTNDDINALSGSASGSSVNASSTSYGTINATSKYVTVGYPYSNTYSMPSLSRHFRINGVTAGFTKRDMDNFENRVGYTQNWDIWQCDVINTGNHSFDINSSWGSNDVINYKYWGVTTESDVNNIDSAILSGLSKDTGTDVTIDWGDIDSSTNEYVCIAFAERLLELSSSRFFMEDDIHGLVSAGFTNEPNFSHTNPYGYTENYDIWLCNAANTGDRKLSTNNGTSIVNYMRWGTTDESTIGNINSDDINGLSGYDVSTDTTRSFGNIDPNGDYICVATRNSLTQITDGKAWRIGKGQLGTYGVTAGFSKVTKSNTNAFGYTENYYVYRCDVTGSWGSKDVSSDNTIVKNTYQVGATTESGVLDSDDINGLSATYDEPTMTGTYTWGSVNPSTSEYIVIGYPARKGEISGSYKFRLHGMTAGFEHFELEDHINLYGYEEDYHTYRSLKHTFSDLNSGGSISLVSNPSYSLLNEIKYGVDPSSSLNTGSDINSLSEGSVTTSNRPAIGSAWELDPNGSNYVYYAYDTLYSSIGTDDFRWVADSGGKDLTCGMTKISGTISRENPAGYTSNHTLWRSIENSLPNGKLYYSTTIKNELRYGIGTNTGSGGYSDSDIANLTGEEIITTDFTHSNLTMNVSGSNYFYYAYPDRLSALSTTTASCDFFVKMDGTNYVSMGMESVVDGVEYKNDYGFSEDYYIYRSIGTGFGNKQFKASNSTSVINYMKYGLTTKSTGYTSADIMGLDDYVVNNNESRTFSETFTPGVGEYFVYAYPKRCGALDHGNDYENDGGTDFTLYKDGDTGTKQTGGLELSDSGLSVTNDAGFTEDYYVYRSTIADMGALTNSALKIKIESSARRYSRFFYGYAQTTNASTALEYILNNIGSGSNPTTTNWKADYLTSSGQYNANTGSTFLPAENHGTLDPDQESGYGWYIWFCYPNRFGSVASNGYQWLLNEVAPGFEGGMEADGDAADGYVVSHTNEMGFTEDYRCYRSDQADLVDCEIKLY